MKLLFIRSAGTSRLGRELPITAELAIGISATVMNTDVEQTIQKAKIQ